MRSYSDLTNVATALPSVLAEGEVQVLRCYLVNIKTEFGTKLSAINETDFLKCIEFIVRKIQPLCPIDIQILSEIYLNKM